jgi:hypothetical protein
MHVSLKIDQMYLLLVQIVTKNVEKKSSVTGIAAKHLYIEFRHRNGAKVARILTHR